MNDFTLKYIYVPIVILGTLKCFAADIKTIQHMQQFTMKP